MRPRIRAHTSRFKVKGSWTYWLWLLAWTLGVVGLLSVYAIIQAHPLAEESRVAMMVWALPGVIASLLPLTVFAGAATGSRGAGTRLWGHLAATAILIYVALAFVDPLLRSERREQRGVEVEVLEPFGPTTPLALLQQRRAVIESPPAAYSFSTSEPLATPPNWLTHLIHAPMVWAVFTILNGWLAALLARKQAGLPALVRFRGLWAQGLLSGFSFLIAMSMAGSLVRGSLEAPGAFWAWLPLGIPAVAILVVRRSLTAPADDAVRPGLFSASTRSE